MNKQPAPLSNVPATASERLLDQLSRNSTPHLDPLARVNWEGLDQDAFWLPEAAISLYGLPQYADLSLSQRKALSRFEFLNFIEAGLWLESLFMKRIGRSLSQPRRRLPELIYHLHELREEAGHSLMFLELIRRTAPELPNDHFYRWNLANVMAHFAPFESIAFWVAVLCGEEVPDRMNRFIRKHRQEICPSVYDIVSIHIMDEARHIAHARDTIEQRLSVTPAWQKRLMRPVINRVFRQFVQTFYFPTQAIYELAGLDPNENWPCLARANPHRIAFVDQCVTSSLRILRDNGLRLNWR